MKPVDSLRHEMPLPIQLQGDDDSQRVTEAAHPASRRVTSRRPRFPAALPITVALLAFGASTASAVGLTLNWGGCIGSGAVSNQNFDCANFGGPYNLVMNLQPPALSSIFAMDVVLDLQTSTAGLSPFWHFESGGCNQTGLAISANRSTIPNTGCLATFTGSTGASVTSIITSITPGFGGGNHVRILATIARSASSPINLTFTANYYVSHFLLVTDNATEGGGGTCDGCLDGASVVWSSASLYNTSNGSTTVTGPGLGSHVATINGGVIGLGISSIIPSLGADSGAVQVQIFGRAFDPAATARLTRTGEADIVGQSTSVQPDGGRLTTTFDLTGRRGGPWNVVVQNQDNTAAILTNGFQVLPTPHVTSIDPSSGGNSGAIPCVVSGHGFTPGALVQLVKAGQPSISGSNVVVAGNGNSLSATFDLLNAATGLWSVVVTNNNGLVSTLVDGFEVHSHFRLSSINPASGADSGSVQVQILGVAIDPAATARLARAGEADIVGQSTSVLPDSTRLTTTFDLTGRRDGLWNVVVQNPSAAAGLTNGFNILLYPRVASIVPTLAYDMGTVPVTITGSGFRFPLFPQLRKGTVVIIPNSTPVVSGAGQTITTSFDVLDLPAGFWDVVVVSADGLTSSIPGGFEIRLGPHITAVTPDHGTNDGVASVQIDGRGLQTGAAARLRKAGSADIVGQSVVVALDGTSLTADFDLSGASIGGWDVTVTNPDLVVATASHAFAVQGFGISSVTPSHGQTGTVVSLAINGSGFIAGAEAWIVPPSEPIIPGQLVTISSPGDRISAVFDLTGHEPALCDVRVRNPGGATFTQLNAFLIESNAEVPSGLDLSWSACNRAATPGADDITLDCGNPGAIARLFGNLQSPETMPAFFAIDAVLDVQTAGAAVPPFWHFEAGGCNEAGLGLSIAKPPTECPSAENGTLWGSTGAAATALITAYAPGYGGANHARLLLTIARAASSPITLNGGQNYYGFDLEVSSYDAGSCDGCATPAQITWSSATLYGIYPQDPIVLSGPGLRSNLVTVNGGPSGVTVASTMPSQAFPDNLLLVQVFGRNLLPGVEVKLRRAGHADIVGQFPAVAGDGRLVTAGFNLFGAVPGLWDIVATNPDEATGEATRAFEILNSATPTQLVLFEGGWVGDRVEVRWRFSDGASFARVAVERAQDERGPWTAIDAVIRNDGDATVVSDAGAVAHATYHYRLVASTADGATSVFGPIVVRPASGPGPVRGSGITLLAPNPTAGAIRIGFALARSGSVRLSVMDVQGREVTTIARGEYAAGRFETAWNGRVGGQDAPMGIYFVRLRVGGVTMTRRLAVAR